MAGMESLTFDVAGCTLGESSENHRFWVNAEGVAHLLRFRPVPVEWPFDLSMPDAAAAFYRQQCIDNRGVMLSMELLKVAGFEVLSGLFKYRAPTPGSLAMYYVGILWIPFGDCNYQINIEAVETGTTGIREATVMALEGDKWPIPDAEPIVLAEGESLFERMRATPLRLIPSDGAAYDATFPSHPLSLVRARLREVAATLGGDASLAALKPFRVKRKWQFWKK